MSKKAKLVPTDDLIYAGVSDIALRGAKQERDIAGELLNKNFQTIAIQGLESAFRPTKRQNPANLKRHNKVFKLDFAADRDQLNLLMNSGRYQINYYKDTFNQVGEYYAFVVWTENLDFKEEEKSNAN